MNILPKKRWHVRTRDNINRVRRDEAKAAEEEREKERRVEVAEREARLQVLRERAKANRVPGTSEEPSTSSSFDHINFFKDLENGETTKNANEEAVAEKKREQEEWEKKVGILTYLGGERVDQAWWEKGRATIQQEETAIKDGSRKESLDPLQDIRGYLGTSGVKRLAERSTEESSKRKKKKRHSSPKKKSSKRKKKRSSDSSDSEAGAKGKKKKSSKRKKAKGYSSEDHSSDNEAVEKSRKKEMLDKLRRERIERENRERQRATRLLNGLNPDAPPEEAKKPPEEGKNRKYNSQFNPDFARQNKLNSKTKYWLE